MRPRVPLQKTLGSCIHELRQRTGLGVKQLAERSGLSRHRIVAIERGKVNLNLGTMLIMAMSLDTTLQELFSRIGGKFGRNSESPQGRLIIISRFGNSSKAQIKRHKLWSLSI